MLRAVEVRAEVETEPSRWGRLAGADNPPIVRPSHPVAFQRPYSRARMMREHGIIGRHYAGQVTQVISGSIGYDDWEWGVTLWARNPEFLKDIVYRMRFDQASARYAEFGPFYVGYLKTAAEILEHCRIAG